MSRKPKRIVLEDHGRCTILRLLKRQSNKQTPLKPGRLGPPPLKEVEIWDSERRSDTPETGQLALLQEWNAAAT